MSLVFAVSLFLSALAALVSLSLLVRARDWRMGFLALMFILMTLHHVPFIKGHPAVGAGHVLHEVPGLLVSVMAVLAVFFLWQMLDERRRAGAVLRESEQRYRTLVESSPDGVAILRDDELVFVNATASRILQAGPGEGLAGQQLFDYTHPSDRAVLRERLRAAVQDGGPSERLEVTLVRPDGTRVDAEVICAPFGTDGTRAAQIILRDVSFQKGLARVQLEREERFRSLVEFMPEAKLVYDAATERFVDANDHAERLFALDRSVLLRRSPADLSPATQPCGAASGAAFASHIQDALGGAQPTFAWTFARAEGSPFHAEVCMKRASAASETLVDIRIADVARGRHAEHDRTLFAQALRSIGEGVFITTLEGRITFVNPAFEATAGYVMDDARGMLLTRMFDVPGAADGLEALLSEQPGAIWDGEVPVRRKDGHTRTALLSLTFVVDEQGQRIAIIGAVRDVSELRKAEAALRASEAKNRALLRAIPDAIFQLDRNGVFLDFIPARGFVPLQPPEMFIGKPITAIKAPVLAARAMEAIERAFEMGAVQRFEYELDEDEGMAFYEARLVPNGEASVVAIIRNVTESRRIEEALRESEEQYRSLIDQSPVAVSVMQEGRYVLLNRAWEQLFGYTAEEATAPGFAYEILLAPESRAHIEERRVARQRGEPVPASYALRVVDRHGRSHDLEATVRDVTWGGRPALQGAYRDVTEQRAYERGLIEAKERAEEMSHLKTTFLANMSHEIRTPLTGIIGFASLLADEVPPAQRELAELIERSGKRLLFTLNSVLDLSMLESGSLRLQREWVDVADEVRERAQLLRPLAAEKGLTLEARVGTAPVDAYMDRGGLGRILNNLVGNAVKFTDHGSIEVEVEAGEASVTVYVRDTGRGIDPSFLPQIFDEFAQESSGITRSHEGVGLGLAITKRLVNLMEGDIEVESAVGRGTTFAVTLPRVPEHAPAPPRRPAQRDPSTGGHVLEGLHVLALDDNLETQTLLMHLLRAPHRVFLAATPGEALAQARAGAFDVVLLDISLGADVSGVEVLRALRDIDGLEDVPVVALTAHALPGDRERLLQHGFDAFLAKPFTKHEFFRMLRALR